MFLKQPEHALDISKAGLWIVVVPHQTVAVAISIRGDLLEHETGFLHDGTAMKENPGLVADLDKYFQPAKHAARVENPSGTARVAHITSQGAPVFSNPFIGGTYMIAGNALARLLYNPRFVKWATRAMNTEATASADATATAAVQLKDTAGKAAVKVSPKSGAEIQGEQLWEKEKSKQPSRKQPKD